LIPRFPSLLLFDITVAVANSLVMMGTTCSFLAQHQAGHHPRSATVTTNQTHTSGAIMTSLSSSLLMMLWPGCRNRSIQIPGNTNRIPTVRPNTKEPIQAVCHAVLRNGQIE
jgi:hypothetical protein